ncbi:MAG: RluA family pseudouridine synthase [Patescibacteria group bacterium]
MQTEFLVDEQEKNQRLDIFLAKQLPDYSRSFLANIIKDGLVLVNNMTEKPSYKIQQGDQITLSERANPLSNHPEAADIDLDIIYEDNDVIVINKQPNLVVHPAGRNRENTLVNALINHFPQIKDAVLESGNPLSESRPGLVQRLDKDTSGVMIIAKDRRAMHSLSRQIQNRTISKTYFALCYGWPKEESGQIRSFVGRHPRNRKLFCEVGEDKGREAVSNYKVEKYLKDKDNNKISLIKFNILTGRTHQIRIHAKSINTPVLGDELYNTKTSELFSHKIGIKRQLLHSYQLEITLPGNNRSSKFTAPLPTDIKIVIDQFSEIS